jgi:hypothetical protein
MKCVPVRIDDDEVVRIDVLATHFHVTRAKAVRAIMRLGIPALFELYKAAPDEAERLLDDGGRWMPLPEPPERKG